MDPIAVLAQQWLAALGITVFLAGGKVRLDGGVERRVQTMETDVKALFKRFSSRRQFAPVPDEPDFARDLSFEKLADDLYETADPAELQRRLEGFPGDLVGELGVAAARAMLWLRNRLPPVRYQTLGGLKYRDPSPRNKEAYLRVFDVADDPFGVLRSLESGTMSGDQIEALQACYPDLYTHWINIGVSSLTTADLSLKKEKQLSLFMGATALSSDISNVVQAMAEESQAEGQASGGSGPGVDFYGSNSDKISAA